MSAEYEAFVGKIVKRKAEDPNNERWKVLELRQSFEFRSDRKKEPAMVIARVPHGNQAVLPGRPCFCMSRLR